MSERNYTPDRRIVCVGSATVGSALLQTVGSLRRSMNDELVTSGSLLVWDTGARCTTLNERIVGTLGLEPTGRTVTLTAPSTVYQREWLTSFSRQMPAAKRPAAW